MTKSNADKQRTRRQRLNELAAEVGYDSWTQLETAALDGKCSITMEEPNMSDASIITKRINSKDSRMELRAGTKGRGKVLHTVLYWPDSGRSVEAAENSIRDFADRKGYNIVATSK